MSGSSPAAQARRNPFVGPRPLEKGQPIFGRDAEIDELYYRLSAERILLFHSPSGAGKSSLLQAGLLPRLGLQFDVWAPARVSLPPGSADAGAVNRYVRSCNLSFEAEVPAELQRPEKMVAAMTLADYVAGRPRRRSAPHNTVLIFDQFEEILTVDPLAFEARREFFQQLGALLQDPRIWAIFALREDYLAQLDPYAEELPTHLKNRFRLDLLRREAAEEAIGKSVAAAGRSFAPEALSRLVTDLAMTQVQQPSGEFRSEPGRYIEPLHLQVTCRGLWERLPADRAVIEQDDVATFGDVTGALADYYASEVARIAGNDERVERAVRQWCGDKLIARGSMRAQVIREAGSSGGLDDALIQRLIDAHLVRAETRASATWYELAHDRLIEPVLQENEHWLAAHMTAVQRRALQWERESEPESLLMAGAELKEAVRWAAAPGRQLTSGESRFLAASRRKRRRLLQARAAVAALLALLVAAAVLGLVARRERDRAEKNLALAEEAVDQTLSSAGAEQGQESADTPAMEAFRKQLLTKAAAFYSAFTREESTNAALRREEAQGHLRLGDVDRLLNQPEKALQEYRLAVAGFASLLKRTPDAPEDREALGYCRNWMGETLRSEAEASSNHALGAEAILQYDAALQLQALLHHEYPGNALYAQELARTYYNRGIILSDLGHHARAESDMRTAMGLLEPVAARSATAAGDSASPPAAEELARADNNLANLLRKDGKNGDARKLYDNAIRLAAQLRQSDPASREYRFELAQYSENEALLFQDTGDLLQATARNHQALDLIEALANPAPDLSLEELQVLQIHTEILLAQGGQGALEESERERDLLSRLGGDASVRDHPLFHVFYLALADNYDQLARNDLKAGDLEGARIALSGFAQILPQLSASDQASARADYLPLRNALGVKLKHLPGQISRRRR